MVVKFKQSSRAAGLLKRGACCVLAASLCFVGPGAYGLTAWADPVVGEDGTITDIGEPPLPEQERGACSRARSI